MLKFYTVRCKIFPVFGNKNRNPCAGFFVQMASDPERPEKCLSKKFDKPAKIRNRRGFYYKV